MTPLVLHLRPGAREWFMAWLERRHPHLVRRYERLYAEGAYAPKWYQRRITGQVHELAQEYGIGPAHTGLPRRVRRHAPEPTAPGPAAAAAGPVTAGPVTAGPTQLSLL